MKTAVLPAVPIEPDLREMVDQVLGEGESLETFIEDSIRNQVLERLARTEFERRGLASLARARDGEPTVPVEVVLQKLEARLQAAREARAGSIGT